MKLRNFLTSKDLPALEEMLRGVGVFTAAEIECCLSLAGETLDGSDEYSWFLAEEAGQIQALICYGPVALTERTYDLYWILRAPKARSRGAAAAVLQAAEGDLRDKKARLFVLNTSGTSPYEPAHQFYRRHGFDLSARIPAYYRPGDDLLIFTKRLE
jgi:ribosomal protein S18 acetylase RimI-like enzyme